MTAHVSAEGFVRVRKGETEAARKYLVIDGYVLRVFDKEPDGAHVEASMIAETIIDLRFVESLDPADPYTPPPHGACTLTAQAEKRKKRKELCILPDNMIGRASEPWWLRHLVSALPDRAVANTMRTWRDPAIVLALMRGHASQPAAHKHTDREWRRAVAQQRQHDEHEATHGKAAHAPGTGKGHKLRSAVCCGAGAVSSPKPNDVASRLARARHERAGGAGGAAMATDDTVEEEEGEESEGDDGFIDVSASPSTEEGANEVLKLALTTDSDDAPPPPPVAAGGGMRLPAPSGRAVGGCTKGSQAAAKCTASAGLEELTLTREEEVEAAAVTEWWFVKTMDGQHTDGPFTNAEMRRKYRKGGVHETTLVRFVPCAPEPPSLDEQRDAAFAPLQEMCTAAGPPFMDS
jgi:hypothetical protein